MDILDKIVQIKNPILILAGPGSGKTYTMAYKLKYLVEVQKINPDEICVITFTNEAAINMRKKISSKSNERIYIREELQPLTICTMHKLGNRIIKDNYSEAGLERANFKILASSDLKNILMMDCAQILGAKRQDANNTILCRQNGECNPTESFKCKLCNEYANLLRRFNYIDHDDQILLACKLLKDNKDILNCEQNKAKYLLVDEYQDINYAQWELIKLLDKGKAENLFVVGDDYQSIYSFRGGNPKYIQNFKNDYAPNAVVLNLTKNYRCPPNILKGAFYMVQKYNGGDIDILDKIEFKKESDVLIKISHFQHSNIEADFIADQIKKIGVSYNSLILIPTFYYAASIKCALRKRFIDFSCSYNIKNTDLYLISILLKWLKYPSDNFNFRLLLERMINEKEISGISTGQRGIALKQISDFWQEIESGKTLYQKIKTLKGDKLFKKLVETIIFFKKAYKGEESIVFISLLIEKLKIWQNVSAFSKEIGSIIEEIEGLTMPGECNVRVMTMNKAKGLEADYVFIVGLENNILPREGSDGKEDSRLFYVSMTRAKKELHLLYSDIRNRNITKVQIDGKSEFIDAIPDQYKVDFVKG